MIISQDIHPQHKVYYWGAIVISILDKLSSQKAYYFQVYEELRKEHEISVEVFSLTLDWLFILGAIEQEQNHIRKCF